MPELQPVPADAAVEPIIAEAEVSGDTEAQPTNTHNHITTQTEADAQRQLPSHDGKTASASTPEATATSSDSVPAAQPAASPQSGNGERSGLPSTWVDFVPDPEIASQSMQEKLLGVPHPSHAGVTARPVQVNPATGNLYLRDQTLIAATVRMQAPQLGGVLSSCAILPLTPSLLDRVDPSERSQLQALLDDSTAPAAYLPSLGLLVKPGEQLAEVVPAAAEALAVAMHPSGPGILPADSSYAPQKSPYLQAVRSRLVDVLMPGRGSTSTLVAAVESGEAARRRRVEAAAERLHGRQDEQQVRDSLHLAPDTHAMVNTTHPAAAAAHDQLVRQAVPSDRLGRPVRHADPSPYLQIINSHWANLAQGSENADYTRWQSGRSDNCVKATRALLHTYDGHPEGARPTNVDWIGATGDPSLLGDAAELALVEQQDFHAPLQELTSSEVGPESALDRIAAVVGNAEQVASAEEAVALAGSAYATAELELEQARQAADDALDRMRMGDEADRQALAAAMGKAAETLAVTRLAAERAKIALRKAEQDLTVARETRHGRRAVVVLTWPDGTRHVTLLLNHHGTLRHLDALTGNEVSNSWLFGAHQIAGVQAVAAASDGRWLPFDGCLLGSDSSYTSANLTPEHLRHLAETDQQRVLAELCAAPSTPLPGGPSDSRLARVFADARRILADLPDVAGFEIVGDGWARVTTVGGEQAMVGIRLGATAEGLSAQTRPIGLAGLRCFEMTLTPRPGVEVIDGFADRRVNESLIQERALVYFASQLDILAAQVDLTAPAARALETMAAAVEQLEASLDETVRERLGAAIAGMRSAIGAPRDVVTLTTAAHELQICVNLLATAVPATDPAQALAATLLSAAENCTLGVSALAAAVTGENALRPGFGVPDQLSLVDRATATEIRVRARLLSEWTDPSSTRSTNVVERRRGARAREERLRRLIARVGLAEDASTIEERRALLLDDEFADLTTVLDEHGVKRRKIPRGEATVDRWWLADTLPTLTRAASVAEINTTDDPNVVTVVDEGVGAVTVAVLLGDGSPTSSAVAKADVTINVEDAGLDPDAVRCLVAGRLRSAVATNRRAVAAGIPLAEVTDLAALGDPGSDILVGRPLGGAVPAEPSLGLGDEYACGWLLAFSEIYDGSLRMRSILNTFLYRRGLLRSLLGLGESPDYNRKIAALERYDPELAAFVRRNNQARPVLRSLAEPGVDRRMLDEPPFDHASLPELVAWLQSRSTAELTRDPQYRLDGDDRVVVTFPGGDTLTLTVRLDELLDSDVDLLSGSTTNEWTAVVHRHIDNRNGALCVVQALSSAIRLHGLGGKNTRLKDGELPPGTVDLLALREHHLAQADRKLRKLIRAEQCAHLALLQEFGIDVADHPGTAPYVEKYGNPRSRKLVGLSEQQLRARLEGGEGTPSRIPTLGVYRVRFLVNLGVMGLVTAGAGMAFGQPWYIAGIAIIFSILQAFARASQLHTNELEYEQKDLARRADRDRQRAEEARARAEVAGRLAGDAILPILESLGSGPVRVEERGRAVDDFWVSRFADPSTAPVSLKSGLLASRKRVFWTVTQSIVNYGVAVGQWGLAASTAIAAFAQAIFRSRSQTVRGRWEVANRLAQRLVDEARAAELLQRRNEELALRLRRALVVLAELSGEDTSAYPSVCRRPVDAWVNRGNLMRPYRGPTYSEALFTQGYEYFLPSTVGSLAVAPFDTAAAAVQFALGAVNTVLGAGTFTGYFGLSEKATDRNASQRIKSLSAASRDLTHRLARELVEEVWTRVTEVLPEPEGGWPKAPRTVGERVESFLMAEKLQSTLPGLLQAFGITGVAPGLVEAGFVFAVGLLAPTQPAEPTTAAEARKAAEANRGSTQSTPGTSWLPGSDHAAILNHEADLANTAYANARDALDAARGTPNEAMAMREVELTERLMDAANQTLAVHKRFETLVVGAIHAFFTSITGPSAARRFDKFLTSLQSDQSVFWAMEELQGIGNMFVQTLYGMQDEIRQALAPKRVVHLSAEFSGRGADPETGESWVGATLGGQGTAVAGIARAGALAGHEVVVVSRQEFCAEGESPRPTQVVRTEDGVTAILVALPEGCTTMADFEADKVAWAAKLELVMKEAADQYLAELDAAAEHADSPPPPRDLVVQLHDWMGTGFGIDLARDRSARLIMNVHSTHAGRRLGKVASDVVFLEEVRRMAAADFVVVNTKKMANEIMHLADVSADKIMVVPNGVDLSKWKVDREGLAQIRAQVLDEALGPDHGITDGDKIVVLAPSRLIAKTKGFEDTLEAMPQIQDRVRAALSSDGGNGRVKLVFVGDGPFRPSLEREVAELVADGRLAAGDVLFPGFLQHEQASKLAGVADLGLLPSHSEAFGLTAIEFAAAGLPMVLTTVFEFAESDDLALRIPYGAPDALAAAVHAGLTDPDASEARANRARSKALGLDYLWSQITKHYGVIYRVETATREEPGDVSVPQVPNVFDRLRVHVVDGDQDLRLVHDAGSVAPAPGGRRPDGTDPHGVYWDVYLTEGTERLELAIDAGNDRYPLETEVSTGKAKANQRLWLDRQGQEVPAPPVRKHKGVRTP